MKAKFIKKTIIHGDIYHRLPNGWLHSCNDQPAVILSTGGQFWYIDNNKHRDNDKPATISNNGQFWYVDGKKHRDGNKPAEIWVDGTKCWCINGNFLY